MSKLVQSTTILDHLTGEVLKSEERVFETKKLDKEPAFIKMYIQDIGLWQGLSSGETSVLYLLATSVDYDGVVSITKYSKDKIRQSLGVSDGFVRNTLTKLVAAGVLLKTANYSGVYKLNPFWFGRGEWKDILEQRKAFVVQLTRAYGMELPASARDGVSFVDIQTQLEKKGQQRLIE